MACGLGRWGPETSASLGRGYVSFCPPAEENCGVRSDGGVQPFSVY